MGDETLQYVAWHYLGRLLLPKVEMANILVTYHYIGAAVVTTFIVGGNKVGV